MIIDDFTTDAITLGNYSANQNAWFEQHLAKIIGDETYAINQTGGDTSHIWFGRRRIKTWAGEVLIAGDGKLVHTARRAGRLQMLYQGGDPQAGAVAGIAPTNVHIVLGTCAATIPTVIHVGSFVNGGLGGYRANLLTGSDNTIPLASFSAGASTNSIGFIMFTFEIPSAGTYEIELLETT